MSRPKKKTSQRIEPQSKQGVSSNSPQRRKRKRVVWWKQRKVQYWLAAAIVLTLIAYLPAFFNGFVNWDDPYYVNSNDYIKSLSFSNLKSIFSESVAGNYHPLTILTLAIEYQLVGLKPFLYHFNNILLHLLNTGLVFYLIYLISNRKIEVAGVVALFFGIHPMHVESVAWVSERKDVLYSAFYLAALIAYTKHIFHKKRLRSTKLKRKPTPTNKYLVYTLLFFVLSTLSKAVAVTIPVVMVLLDLYLNRIRLGRNKPILLKEVLLEKVPFFALSLVFGIIALNVQKEAGAVAEFATYSVGERFVYAAYGFLHYIGKFFVPINLSAFYPYPAELTTSYMMAPLVVLGLYAAAIYVYSKSRIPLFGLLFYGVTIALVLQFISVGIAIVADRYTYLPYIGLLFILAMGFHNLRQRVDMTGRMWQNIAKRAIGVYTLAFVLMTFQRTKVWEDSLILWNDVLEQFSDTAWIGYINRATYFFNKGQHQKAVDDYSSAIRISKLPSFYYNRGLAYEQLREYEKSLDDYSKAIQMKTNYQDAISARANIYKKINPDLALEEFESALELDSSDHRAYINRGSLYREEGNHEKAIEDFSKAIEACNCYEAYYNRAGVYQTLNDNEKAMADFNKSLELKPDAVNAYANRGNLYRLMGQPEKAMADFDKSLEVKDSYEGLFNRGLLYNDLKQMDKAVVDYTRAIALDESRADGYTNRGNVYFATQQLDLALADYNKSLELDPNYDNAYGNRGAVHFQQKNYPAALEDFKKALEVNPDHKDARMNRAATYLTLGQCENATVDLEYLLSQNPNNQQAKKWLEGCE